MGRKDVLYLLISLEMILPKDRRADPDLTVCAHSRHMNVANCAGCVGGIQIVP